MKTRAKMARTTKGWQTLAPKSPGDRVLLYQRCGAKAFLAPNKAKPERSKFPVMPKTGSCVIDCRGLRAAKARAQQYGHRSASAKADRLARRNACEWAV